MILKYRSFFLAALLAFILQIAVLFVVKLLLAGMDCGLLEKRICSLPVFLDGVAYLAASINLYTLGIPTIVLALLFGGAWRMYKELRAGGATAADFLSR